MNEILKTALSLSVSGSLLILILVLGRPLYRNRCSRRWQYYIWLVAAARLLLPFAPPASPVGGLFREIGRSAVQTGSSPASGQEVNPALQPENNAAADGGVIGRDGEIPEAAVSTVKAALAAIRNHLWLVWLAAALILLIRKITIYQGFVHYIRAGSTEVSDAALLDKLAQLGEQAGVKRPVELYTNSLVFSPLLLGFFRPCIVLPAAELPESDFKYTVLHELTHYKRRDMFYKWLIQIIICLHWSNPFVYLMGREVNRACELACDEAVISGLDGKERRAYGDTLIRAIGAGGNFKNSLASVTLNESKQLLKERLGAIMKFKKTTKTAAVITVLCTMLFCVGAVSAGAYTTARVAGNSPSPVKQRKAAEYAVDIRAEDCNVIIMNAEGDEFAYEYDKSMYQVNGKRQGDVFLITAGLLPGVEKYTGISEDKRIRIKIPDDTYPAITITGSGAGISVLPFDADMSVINNNGAASVYLSSSFNKSLHFSVKSGSGSLKLEEGLTDFSFKAEIKDSAFKPAEGMPDYVFQKSYKYVSGKGTADIELELQKSAFAIKRYTGEAAGHLKTDFDVVTGNKKPAKEKNREAVSYIK